jgi:hypothetical protein
MLNLPFEFTLTLGDIQNYVTSLLSWQYIGNMLKEGFEAAKDKQIAFECMLPYFWLNSMFILSCWYSQFWKEYNLWFVFYIGILLANMTGNLNLKGCARMRYNPYYFDPPVFCLILYLDYNRVFESETIKYMYIALAVQRLVLYILFLKSLIVQICDYLDIPFIMTL